VGFTVVNSTSDVSPCFGVFTSFGGFASFYGAATAGFACSFSSPPDEDTVTVVRYLSRRTVGFGHFKGKTHLELYQADPSYATWGMRQINPAMALRNVIDFCLFCDKFIHLIDP
jgi:hypothetical protein